MKKFLAFSTALFSVFISMAQFHGAAPTSKTSQQAAHNIGHIYKVADSLGNPIADVTVFLLQNKFDTLTKKKKEVTL